MENNYKKIGLIGKPIEHSLSPLMQNYMLEKLNLEYNYLPYKIEENDFKQFLDSAKSLNIIGFNCTMPYKETAFNNMDNVFGDALVCKSVNTVVFKNNKWNGYSTDGDGFNLSLEELGIKFYNKKVLIIGAGGASKAIVNSGFKNNCSSITILNRDLEKAKEIIKDYKNAYAYYFTLSNLEEETEKADIIINSTPLGMTGVDKDFQNFKFLDTILGNQKIICDLIYSPLETNLLKNAREKGHITINGLGMLIYQGILSLEIFTDTKINYFEMKKDVEKYLKIHLEK